MITSFLLIIMLFSIESVTVLIGSHGLGHGSQAQMLALKDDCPCNLSNIESLLEKIIGGNRVGFERLHRVDTLHVLFINIEVLIAILIFILEAKIEEIDFNFIINKPSVLWKYNMIKELTMGKSARDRLCCDEEGDPLRMTSTRRKLNEFFKSYYNPILRVIALDIILLLVLFILYLFLIENELFWNMYFVVLAGMWLTLPIIIEVLANLADPGRLLYGATAYIMEPKYLASSLRLRSKLYGAFVAAPVAALLIYFPFSIESSINNAGLFHNPYVQLNAVSYIAIVLVTSVFFMVHRMASNTTRRLKLIAFLLFVVWLLSIYNAVILYSQFHALYNGIRIIILALLFTILILVNYKIYYGRIRLNLPGGSGMTLRDYMQTGRLSKLLRKVKGIFLVLTVGSVVGSETLEEYYSSYYSYVLDNLKTNERSRSRDFAFEAAYLGFVQLLLELSQMDGSVRRLEERREEADLLIAGKELESNVKNDIRRNSEEQYLEWVMLLKDEKLYSIILLLLDKSVTEEAITDLFAILALEATVLVLLRSDRIKLSPLIGGMESLVSNQQLVLSIALLITIIIIMYSYYVKGNRRILNIVMELRSLLLLACVDNIHLFDREAFKNITEEIYFLELEERKDLERYIKIVEDIICT
ncbi:MAG: hypothetical protein GSR74_00050 [Desulfurococcales archaeon]|nr:hypothetical protein [Desulfurococcales archaeon]